LNEQVWRRVLPDVVLTPLELCDERCRKAMLLLWMLVVPTRSRIVIFCVFRDWNPVTFAGPGTKINLAAA
jgi:hypothetical protein